MNFDNSITIKDKIAILIDIAIKLVRGSIRGIGIKRDGLGYLLVGKNVNLLNKHNIHIGKNVKFEKNCEIQGLSENGIKMGDYVTIGENVMIRPSSFYGIDCGSGMEIGNHSSIGPFGYIGCSGFIKIGNNVMIGPRCSFFSENHLFEDKDKTIKEQGVFRKTITIEDDCWIGSGCIILSGVTIGKGSVIGAGTIVTKDIPPYSKVIDKRDKRIDKR